MKKVDLHVHSKYSPTPSEWILRQIGMNECYTSIGQVYESAKEQGMDYVTITDHNVIDGIMKLHEVYPKDTFTGVEVTTTFPEDGCKMHLLVYDISRKQFEHIDSIRGNIYTLRDYLKRENIPCSLAHATYAVNGKLTIDVFEKLVLLFDVFEGINGARNPYFNNAWTEFLKNLTPAKIDRMYKKHGIEPISCDPWIKGFTGGSDDHASLFIGRTFTQANVSSRDEFLAALRDKRTLAGGRSNNYKSMAFMFYKILYDHGKSKPAEKKSRLMGIFNKIVFEGEGPSFKEAFILHRLKYSGKKKEKFLAGFIDGLERELLKGDRPLSVEEKIDIIYNRLAILSDDFLTLLTKRSSRDVESRDMFKLFDHISTLLPVFHLTMPFVGTWAHLHKDRPLLETLRNQYVGKQSAKTKRVLWFTDTLMDLNGVSVTVRNMMQCARKLELPLSVVTCNPKITEDISAAEGLINLPAAVSLTPDFYKDYTMNFPSILKAMEKVASYDPQEIVISTPGPVGLLGLLAAKVLGIPCTGIYHSDFQAQFNFIMGDGYSPIAIEKYTRWFYEQMDTIRVPTRAYIDVLRGKGIINKKMKIFKRGMDPEFFGVDSKPDVALKEKLGLAEGFTLIYAGRVSKDKNLDFLAKVYRQVHEQNKNVNLIIAGKGPYLEELKEKLRDFPRVKFTGQVPREELARLFCLSDLLVFPSTTDTFGMAVLEALSCGVPALVSDVGGPKEIIGHIPVGHALPIDADLWVREILNFIEMQALSPYEFERMRAQARELVRRNYSLEKSLEDLLSIRLPLGPKKASRPIRRIFQKNLPLTSRLQ